MDIFSYSTWGIFDSSGDSLFQALNISLISSSTRLSTASLEYHKEARVSDFPVEEGSFASYNKVEMPSAPIVVLCLSGSASDRQSFLNKIEAAVQSTGLYSVVTPEVTYINHTIERYTTPARVPRGQTS